MSNITALTAKRIDQKLALIQKARPLSPSVVQKLRDQFSVEFTYNSNAIEGNRLTLKETYLVISEGITIKGRSLKDHLEAKDHYEAIQFLFDLIEKDRRHSINEQLIRSLQHLVVRESKPEIAGSYRKGSVMISGSAHTPPEAHEVPQQMQRFIQWMRKNQSKLHPIEFAALAHHRLVFIHPFSDGNGRAARLLMNLLLMQRGYPLVSVLKNDRKKYYDVLERADRGRVEPLVRLCIQAVERSLNLYLKVMGKNNGTTPKYLPLSVVAKGTKYSAKYLNLLVRQGKLEAHKEGRNWVTSREALEQYISARLRKR